MQRMVRKNHIPPPPQEPAPEPPLVNGYRDYCKSHHKKYKLEGHSKSKPRQANKFNPFGFMR